jgi:hypothetical protein
VQVHRVIIIKKDFIIREKEKQMKINREK